MNCPSPADADKRRTAAQFVNRAFDLGVTFFDNSAVYGPGHSELLGQATRDLRNRDRNDESDSHSVRAEFVSSTTDGTASTGTNYFRQAGARLGSAVVGPVLATRLASLLFEKG